MASIDVPEGLEILGPVSDTHATILTRDALTFYATLHRAFNPRRLELLEKRKARQAELDLGALPDFHPETQSVRDGDWRVDPVPADFQDRRVEITGPVDRKMVINALNSGAKTYMADFEDSHGPTWEATLDGQVNLYDAIRRQIDFTAPNGKEYKLNAQVATLIVRPRGWHLSEKHVLVDGERASGSLFDFALYFFHNAKYRAEQGSGVYLYLPKMEHYLEARLWNDVFEKAQELLGLPRGTVKGTVLIEHILAAFQMDEILYELRHHSGGLNCGRWDYIFSYIKKFARKEEYLVPDRALVGMTTPFMRAYSLACIKTCHKRGAFAMGGMAAQIPIKNDPEANDKAMAKVHADKKREAEDGHDGTWVAHPALVAIAMEEFDKVLGDKPNQIDKQRDDVRVSQAALLEIPAGAITEHGIRENIKVGVQYLEAWLRGVGCVPLYNLMEDAATAEISRTQLWQWVHNPKAVLDDGRPVTLELVRQIAGEEMDAIQAEVGADRFESGKYHEAARLFDEFTANGELAEFLTLAAYEQLD
ncbi:MAG: malate synthase A [Candidatus Hydrogenedentes bacterium]|nr:malate synthase A [Candidatus Hydrogenedentota bacterium]